MTWYTQDPRPVTGSVAAFLSRINPITTEPESRLVQVSFYGKCSEDTPPTAETPYTAIFIDESTGQCVPVAELVKQGWTVDQWTVVPG